MSEPASADTTHWIRLLGWAGLVGFCVQSLKTIGFPNLWAATHLNFDYHFGFMKRALLGAVLRSLGLDMGRYANVMIVGYGALLVAFAALWWLGRRAGLQRTTSAAFLGALFWSSWAVAYSVHTVGYPDHVLLLLALASVALCLRLPVLPAVALASGLGSVGMLIHENYLVAEAPLVFACLVLQRRYAGCAAFGAVLAAVMLVLLGQGVPDGVSRAELEQHYRSLMAYGFRPDAFDLFYHDITWNFGEMWRRLNDRRHASSLALSLLVFGSVAAPLIVAATSVATRGVASGLHRRLLACALPAAALSPLVLHLVGWDMHRWNTLVVVNAFVLLCLAQLVSGEAIEFSGAARWRWYRAGTFAAFLGLATGFGLFNRMQIVNAPYQSHLEYVLDVLDGKAEFPRVPRR